MTQQVLFSKYLEDKRIYNLNQGYWKRKLQTKLNTKLTKESELFQNKDAKGDKIYDANPIFTFINNSKSKAIRIIQDDIALMEAPVEERDLIFAEDELSLVSTDQDNYLISTENENYLISAWLDTIIYKSEVEIPELVIALVLTKETVSKAMNLVSFWLTNGLTSETIDEIILNKNG